MDDPRSLRPLAAPLRPFPCPACSAQCCSLGRTKLGALRLGHPPGDCSLLAYTSAGRVTVLERTEVAQ